MQRRFVRLGGLPLLVLGVLALGVVVYPPTPAQAQEVNVSTDLRLARAESFCPELRLSPGADCTTLQAGSVVELRSQLYDEFGNLMGAFTQAGINIGYARLCTSDGIPNTAFVGLTTDTTPNWCGTRTDVGGVTVLPRAGGFGLVGGRVVQIGTGLPVSTGFVIGLGGQLIPRSALPILSPFLPFNPGFFSPGVFGPVFSPLAPRPIFGPFIELGR